MTNNILEICISKEFDDINHKTMLIGHIFGDFGHVSTNYRTFTHNIVLLLCLGGHIKGEN